MSTKPPKISPRPTPAPAPTPAPTAAPAPTPAPTPAPPPVLDSKKKYPWHPGMKSHERLALILALKIVEQSKRVAATPNDPGNAAYQVEIDAMVEALRLSDQYAKMQPDAFTLGWANDIVWRSQPFLRRGKAS